MKYYFLNYLDFGKSSTRILITIKKEVLMKKASKSKIPPFSKWEYKNIYVNGKKVKFEDIWNKDIKEGLIRVGRNVLKIKDFVLINETALVKDVNKTKRNWENWWKSIREKSDVDLYDKLWIGAEHKLGAEPLFVKKDFENKVVLDAGCGTGRYLPLFSKFGAKEIIAVDLGRQVFEAWNQDIPKENLHLIQSDLMALPLKREIIDTIGSHGVLHHTPDPYKTFKKLSTHLKYGGTQAIYVYHKEWWHFSAHKKSYLLDVLYDIGILVWQSIRKIMSRMPHFVIISFCYLLAVKGTFEQKLMNSKNRFLQVLGKIFFSIPPICYIGVNFHERVVRNYDHYSATFNYFQTIDEVEEWFRKAGFNDLEVASVPVSVRGIKSKSSKPLRVTKYRFISHFQFRDMWEKIYKNAKKK